MMKENDTAFVRVPELFTSPDSFFDILISMIEYRGLDDVTHAKRIRSYTEILLQGILITDRDRYNLTSDDIDVYAKSSVLHDIGKLMIPEYILLKKGRLTSREREVMKLHSIRGAQIIEQLCSTFNPKYYQACYDICKYHHERWDGSGYPEGLAGEEIPFGARVVAIVDVYDALTSVKPYKPRLPHKTAVEMITNGECGMFDPNILECFKNVRNGFEKVSTEFFGAYK